MYNRKPLPPLKALKVFESAARHLSFKLAAEELFVTQSAISRQVQLLEEYYGTPLFIRKTRKVELTSEGRILYKASTTALDYIAAASHEIFMKQKRGYLIIASTITFSTLWIMPRMNDLREQYPDIQFHLMTCEASPNLHDAFDIAITLDFEETKGFEATPLFSEEIFPVCTPSFLEKNPNINSIHDVLQQPLLELNRDHWKYKKWSPVGWGRWLQENSITEPPRNTIMSFNHYPLVLNAIKNNMGIGLTWAHLTELELESGNLVRPISDTYQAPDRKHYLVIREELRDAPEVIFFKNWILKQTENLRLDSF